MKALEELVGLLTRLPGIGRKSALRVAYHLLRSDPAFAQALAERIAGLQKAIVICSVCGSYTESDPCSVCSSPARDRSLICAVEQPQDVVTIEGSREYRGLYHVLGGLISPLDGVGPENLKIQSLIARIRAGGVTEVVVATNPTVEGEATAVYLARLLKPLGVRATRIAMGIPVGSDLEYADEVTMSKSLENRREM